ncbi:MAG TPA: Rrf2 family transcriptional regulator [Nitrospiraceae bacterium]|nr:Rrf2 family transcriptional regulator [Nitrospiraceae bacterium]
MRVSLKATYGIMASIDLAIQNGNVPIQSKAIARRQGIPVRFLEQVLHAMKQAGLVDSVRGAQGGYVLAKTPSELSLAEIVEALDGPLTTPKQPTTLHRRVSGGTPFNSLICDIWAQVRQAELGVLSAVTLKDLVERHRRLEQERALMYHI